MDIVGYSFEQYISLYWVAYTCLSVSLPTFVYDQSLTFVCCCL